MLGESRLREIAERALRASSADQTEVLVNSGQTDLTRFAFNTIHQNVTETNLGVRVRVISDKRVGVASGNNPSDEGIERLVEKAQHAASFQKENPEFVSLPTAEASSSVDAFVEATAQTTPEERADGVGKILRHARENGLEAAGAFSTESNEFLVANSLGVRAYHAGTLASVSTVVMGETSSGYAADVSTDVGTLDLDGVGALAVDKALRSVDPGPVEPGEYTVILEAPAANTMLFFLGVMGLGALSLQEKRSFMAGKLGEKITDERISIWDDGRSPDGIPISIDFEGIPKQPVSLIENGVAKGVVYDSFTAGREEGKASTGHALPSPNLFGPIPINLFMAPGDATVEEMIASTPRGILVTRFHYTNPLHPVKTIITGMTRDGTFLIENGKVTRPLCNLRFTQSIVEALSKVEMIGSQAQLAQSPFGAAATSAPALKVQGFRFTGTTEF